MDQETDAADLLQAIIEKLQVVFELEREMLKDLQNDDPTPREYANFLWRRN